MTKQLISVVMPCYNSAATLPTSVASAFEQTYPNVEVVVVDDGSKDDSIAVLEELQTKYPRLTVIRQANQGAGPARNRGIRAASGALIAFLDADDTWVPECLEKLYQALAAAPDAVLAYCGWQNLGLEPQRCQPYIPPDYETLNKVESFLGTCPWPIHAALVKRETLEECGGFDEQWTSCMDYDLWLRLGSFRPIVRVPEVLAFYHHHAADSRITLNRKRIALNHWRIQRKFLAEHPEVRETLGRARVRELTHGELMQRGFEAYWKGDIHTAREIFRPVMRSGYGKPRDWRYMLPSILPETWHRKLLQMFRDKRAERAGQPINPR